MNYKIWIVATKEIGSLFSTIWAVSHNVENWEEAIDAILKLKKERQIDWDDSSPLKYWIIFVLEEYLINVSNEEYKKISSWALPAVISIPSHKWSSWYWNLKIKKIVEKAVWSDIFWN